MRFDNKIKPELNLTTRQRLFGEVWFNLVHEYSLDAFRVRTMNPVNVINELVRSFTVQPFNDRDRAKIIAEAVELLATSLLIRQGALGEIADELILLLDQWGKKSRRDEGVENKAAADIKDNGVTSHAMILAFGREMESALNEVFLRACIDWLTAQLTDAAPLAQDDQTENIVQITGQMLSHLISVGWSFESLFQLYRRAFAQDSQHTPEGEAYDFARALRWLFARVARAPKDYVITFTINQVATGAELPNRVGDIVFSPEALRVSESSSAPVRRVAQAAPGRIFATMTVEANDSRIAGMRAAEHIEQVLDVLRYDFIKQNFSLSDRFLVQKATHHVALEIAKTVPNEKREVTPAQFQTFMEQLRNLVASGTLEADSKDRIYAAFRLYRTGAETANLENKLVQWWTALEYLVKASGGGIGDAVERALYPTVVLAYLPKHLNSLRLALLEFDAPLILSDGTQPDLVSCRLPELLMYCKDQGFKRGAMAAAQSKSPYAEHYFASLFKKVESPKSELEALDRHERAVRWQIQRIYRARCDIVHSAGRVPQVALLCANLESYLKILLDTFLISLQKIDTLRTPREFFDRQHHVQARIKAQLGAKPVASEALLLAALSKHL
ncbi:hypothetical protein JAB8_19880 [Janthinobacterium sp. HH106]|uniref:hypothetical protein n=1 Tax=Janthinobacterium sp. HH106 TaxID=1537278 RepID=UPI000873CE28|nr:hypothetical protein [Janthinobacterium sp. HH106]OEZ90545.1 hypothetical protein JAB8_19880 [Janthinobacterium sp. HH106]